MASTKQHNAQQIAGQGKAHKFKHRTSIGRSVFSRPKNKHKKKGWKKYRGQGF